MSSDEVREFQVSVPAGTPQAAPVVIPTRFPDRIVDEITWRVPAGPNGLMGFRVSMGGVQVLPQAAGQYVVANGQSGTWQVKNMPNTGAWDVTAYNTGANAHVVYITYHLTIMRPEVKLPEIFPWESLMPAPDLSQAGPPVRPR